MWNWNTRFVCFEILFPTFSHRVVQFLLKTKLQVGQKSWSKVNLALAFRDGLSKRSLRPCATGRRTDELISIDQQNSKTPLTL